MIIKRPIKSTFLTLFFLVNILTFAQSDTDAISATIDVYVVDTSSDKEILKKQDEVKPGQLIEYHLNYKNKTNETVKINSADAMVPKNTDFVEASNQTAVNSTFMVSIDQGKTFDRIPVMRTKLVEGKKQSYVVPATEYTHVRWSNPESLKGGEVQTYIYRVKVK